MGKKYGFSFSFSRLIGLQTFKQAIARYIGIPTTKLGRQRKVGNFILSFLLGKKH